MFIDALWCSLHTCMKTISSIIDHYNILLILFNFVFMIDTYYYLFIVSAQNLPNGEETQKRKAKGFFACSYSCVLGRFIHVHTRRRSGRLCGWLCCLVVAGERTDGGAPQRSHGDAAEQLAPLAAALPSFHGSRPAVRSSTAHARPFTGGQECAAMQSSECVGTTNGRDGGGSVWRSPSTSERRGRPAAPFRHLAVWLHSAWSLPSSLFFVVCRCPSRWSVVLFRLVGVALCPPSLSSRCCPPARWPARPRAPPARSRPAPRPPRLLHRPRPPMTAPRPATRPASWRSCSERPRRRACRSMFRGRDWCCPRRAACRPSPTRADRRRSAPCPLASASQLCRLRRPSLASVCSSTAVADMRRPTTTESRTSSSS